MQLSLFSFRILDRWFLKSLFYIFKCALVKFNKKIQCGVCLHFVNYSSIFYSNLCCHEKKSKFLFYFCAIMLNNCRVYFLSNANLSLMHKTYKTDARNVQKISRKQKQFDRFECFSSLFKEYIRYCYIKHIRNDTKMLWLNVFIVELNALNKNFSKKCIIVISYRSKSEKWKEKRNILHL
jgi:hypothetical protein